MNLAWIDPHTTQDPFPDVSDALTEPDGLLAIGGHLEPDLLLTAYRRSIFPWYSEGQPVLWWSPDPRTVIFPDRLHVARSLRRAIRTRGYTTTLDRDFQAVITACSRPRPGQDGTWITPAMLRAYVKLARLGHAHSVEVWAGDALIGGLYGVAIGRVFFGESMFSLRSDASKIALVRLSQELLRRGYRLIDCQVRSAHLSSLGAQPLPRRRFVEALALWCSQRPEQPLGSADAA